MDSLYGGHAGLSLIYKDSFESVEAAIAACKRGPDYDRCWYGELILITTPNLNDEDNGIIFQRGLDYTNDMGGLVRIGQIVGPSGGTPLFALSTIEEAKRISTMPIDENDYRKYPISYDTDDSGHVIGYNFNTDANEIMKDGTYLRIKDGRYVEENKTVRPNCYEFVGFYDTDFDAYFVLFEPTSEFKGIIVDKDVFKTSSSISIQGKELKLNNAIKIKLTSKPMMECDLIQTSSNNQMIESAELLNYPKLKEDGTIDYIYTGYFEKIEKDQDEKTEIIKQTNAEFVEKYKNGQYVIDKVVDDEGNLVELDQQKKRYSLSTIKTIPDPANDLQQYKYFGKDNLIYDARTGRFTGGPKYNTKAAIGREIGKGLKNLFIATASLFSLGGVFALAIAPVAVLGVFAGLVAYPIGKSIVEAIKGFRINRKNAKAKK